MRDAFQTGVAADREGRNAFLRLNLAYALSALGEHDAAFAAYQAGMDILKAETRISRTLRAGMHFNKGEYAQAEVLTRRNLADKASIRPNEYHALARTLDVMNRTDEALEILRVGRAQFPQYCNLYDRAGEFLLKRGRIAEALAEWERGIAAIPKCDANYVSLAKALIEQKRFSEARKKLETLQNVSPDSDGAEEAKELLKTLGS